MDTTRRDLNAKLWLKLKSSSIALFNMQMCTLPALQQQKLKLWQLMMVVIALMHHLVLLICSMSVRAPNEMFQYFF